MENYIELEALIFHLESNALIYEYPFQIAQLFQIIRDKNINNEMNLAEKAQTEMEVFSFHLQDGEVKPFYIFPDKNGDNIEYPKLSNYSKEALEYLEVRMDKSKNPFLKSRYAHIRWCSPKKHGRFAIIALDSYQELVEQYQIEYLKSGKYDNELLETIKNIYFIAKNIKDIIKLYLIKVRVHSLIPIFDAKRRQNF